jgi:cation diffusion facilitator CzcD-associated flavoprotein CzcO
MSVPADIDHVDVVIVGAGLSGIGAACHLRRDCPGSSFTILESRDATGGTWDLFRYPGVRSDSDMYTLGYSFRPWQNPQSIADGASILSYVRDTAREYGVDRAIRFRHRVVRAEWSTADARWTVYAERGDTGEVVTISCGFLFTCTGYYRYDEGHAPAFEGTERFSGPIVHPQHWPTDLDYDGKRVVVIGSGATAVTLVPAMAERAAHVTMLQRSPGYIVAQPARDALAVRLRRLLPARQAYPIIRWKHVMLTMVSYEVSRRRPRLMKRLIRKGVESQLPPGYDVDTDFTPRYDPWDQRLCLVPDADLFAAIRNGSASIVTATVEAFTETGVRLTSGEELDADIIVTATGLTMLALGGMTIAVDGDEVDLAQTVAYKGMMFSGIPNLAAAIGYTNASWTLRADLISDYVCRLLREMTTRGLRQCTPRWTGSSLPTARFMNLSSGYVLRSAHLFPKQADQAPWRVYQNYLRDLLLLRRGALDDGALVFSNPVPDRVVAR